MFKNFDRLINDDLNKLKSTLEEQLHIKGVPQNHPSSNDSWQDDFENRLAEAIKYVEHHNYILNGSLDVTFGIGIQEALINRNIIELSESKVYKEWFSPIKVYTKPKTKEKK